MREARLLSFLLSAAAVAALLPACLTRPVACDEPTTRTNFTVNVAEEVVRKVDLLFMIDNSESMGDKQELLAQAVPDLVNRLVNPDCLDATGAVVGVSVNGACPAGQALEFPPVHDLHIAVVSSSLGGRGSDACPASQPNPVYPELNAHNDDQGHLLNRGDTSVDGSSETPIADEGSLDFLAWFPTVAANVDAGAPPVPAVTDPNQLVSDFTTLVRGVHEYGCAYAAQLESWYRFLIQPNPFAQILQGPNSPNQRVLDGVDATILQQRAAFLRPDSLVAIFVVTDSNDTTVDPLAMGGDEVGGEGWEFENSAFPGSDTGGAPKGTSACAASPTDAACSSCAFPENAVDPACTPEKYLDPYTTDPLNVRFFHMKQRFGIDPQFPISRYVRGLSLPTVPNRDQEHQNGGAAYTGDTAAGCTNPLFAASLPTDPSQELCMLPAGKRSPREVFYVAVTGVPYELLHFDPNDAQASLLTAQDWVAILGNDPLNYDFSGADPHMLESPTPRAGLPPPTASDTADPINGREWDTGGNDLQFACVFTLATPKDCRLPEYAHACYCNSGLNPPLCDPMTPTTQIRGEAQPAIRELAVARALGQQAVVSSMCPIHTTEASPGDPLYGYRPAMQAIVDRLRGVLGSECLPEPLVTDDTGVVPCVVLETLAAPGDESACDDAAHGLATPTSDVLDPYRKAHPEAATFPVCAVTQLTKDQMDAEGSCTGSPMPGFCYVAGAAAGACNQGIVFSRAGTPSLGSAIAIQCIEAAPSAGGTCQSPDPAD